MCLRFLSTKIVGKQNNWKISSFRDAGKQNEIYLYKDFNKFYSNFKLDLSCFTKL
jgi:hypothetical protein